MKRDQELVSNLLTALNQQYGTRLAVVRRPDEEDRTFPAVEALARDAAGQTTAIEHTLLQPFDGERADSERFVRVFGQLEGCTELIKPGCNVDIIVRVGVIPTGVEWDCVSGRVLEHLKERIPLLGGGTAVELITGLPFELPITVVIQQHGLGEVDHVWISRFESAAPSLKQVMRRAFERKLPKLLAEKADRRVLLLEQADFAHGHAAIRVEISKLLPDFPDLKQIDEIWLVITTCWERENALFFCEIWPDLNRRKLKLDPRTSATRLLGV
jgi:hypothetical protein